MTKFARTLIASIIVLGSAGLAHAGDDTFTTTLKIDTAASAEATYTSLQKQAKLACRREATRSGYTVATAPKQLLRKCEKETLKNAIHTSENLNLMVLHQDISGDKIPAQLFAKK